MIEAPRPPLECHILFEWSRKLCIMNVFFRRRLPSVFYMAELLLSRAIIHQSSALEDEPRFCNSYHKAKNNECAVYPRKIDGIVV